ALWELPDSAAVHLMIARPAKSGSMNMKRLVAGALALTLAATAIPSAAFAHDWRHSYSRHYYDRRGNAVAAGVVGLALGAMLGRAITDGCCRRYYDRCYDGCGYGNRYYYDDYDDDYGPSLCIVRERRWDPYSGREVFIEERRPC